jgi:2-polyprenyl-3-methyl-5-hydroxy-6-metoxy-1,4-benzoquinol methylase
VQYNAPPFHGGKLIVTIHDIAFIHFPETFNRFQRFRLKLLVPLNAKKAERVICGSQYSKKDISEFCKVDETKIEVTPYGVSSSCKIIENGSEKRKKILAKYGIKQKFIFSLGRLNERKNLSSLIAAYKYLRDSNKLDLSLVIAGNKDFLFEKVVADIENSGYEEDIILTGYIDDSDLPVIFSSAELFVYPSLFEGFGLPPLEAMICKCPVIASNVTSIPEVVGDAGILVDPNSIDEISQAIYRVMSNPELRVEMKKKGFEKAQMFSWKTAARKTLSIYEEEYPKLCNLCNSPNNKVMFEHEFLKGPVRKCMQCGLNWVDISNEVELIKDFQTQTERNEAYSRIDGLVSDRLNVRKEIEISERENKRLCFVDRIKRIDQFWQKSKEKTTLLEIGCGEGLFLEQARNFGYNVKGIEPNNETSKYARESLGIDVQTATLAEAEIEDESIDIVVMFHVIEHLLDPNFEISKIRNLLKTKGLLVIETPNISSLPYKLLRRKWRQFIPDHYWFFSEKTIHSFLDKHGFKILQIKSIGKKVSIQFFLNRLGRWNKVSADLLSRIMRFLGVGKKSLYINPFDVMIVFAEKLK